MLDVRADDWGSSFGSEGDLSPLPVLEGVHFLLHDVRRFADRASEKAGCFECGSSDFSVAEGLKDPNRGPLYVLPLGCLLGKNVACTFNYLESHRQV